MSLRIFRVAVQTTALLFVVVAAGNGLVAQDQPPSDEDAGNQYEHQLASPVTIEMSDSSVSDYANEIRNLVPSINIVVTKAAADLRLPEIKLNAVPARGALSLLNSVTNQEIEVDFQSRAGGNEADVVLITAPNSGPFSSGTEVRVFNIKQLLGASNRDALLSSLESGFQMLGGSSQPVDVKIHEATGLLFIKGSGQQLALAESIIHELEKGLGYAAPPIFPSEAPALNAVPPVESHPDK
jgi:hypothetical protein